MDDFNANLEINELQVETTKGEALSHAEVEQTQTNIEQLKETNSEDVRDENQEESEDLDEFKEGNDSNRAIEEGQPIENLDDISESIEENVPDENQADEGYEDLDELGKTPYDVADVTDSGGYEDIDSLIEDIGIEDADLYDDEPEDLDDFMESEEKETLSEENEATEAIEAVAVQEEGEPVEGETIQREAIEDEPTQEEVEGKATDTTDAAGEVNDETRVTDDVGYDITANNVNSDELSDDENLDMAGDKTADEKGDDVNADANDRDVDAGEESDINEYDVDADDLDDHTDTDVDTGDDTINASGEADVEDRVVDNEQNDAETVDEETSDGTVEDDSTNGSEDESENDIPDEIDTEDAGSDTDGAPGTEKSDIDSDESDEAEGGKTDSESAGESMVENEDDSDDPESKDPIYGNDVLKTEDDVSDESDIYSNNVESDKESTDDSLEETSESIIDGDKLDDNISESDALEISGEADAIEDSNDNLVDNEAMVSDEGGLADDALGSENNEDVFGDSSVDLKRNPKSENLYSESDASSDDIDNKGDMADISEDNTDTMSEEGTHNSEGVNQEQLENRFYHQGQNDIGALGTCGLTSIANSLNILTGTRDCSENSILHIAMDNDLCCKSDNPYACGGTTTKDVVDIIDKVKHPESNIHTEIYDYDKVLDVDSLADRLDDSGIVAIVGVDSATLWDQRGDVSNSGLFQRAFESPSDHWITVDSPVRDENGIVTGFNIIDSGGGGGFVDRDRFERMYIGDDNHKISDPTAILVSNKGDAVNSYFQPEGVERTSNYKGEGSREKSDLGSPPEKNSKEDELSELDKKGYEEFAGRTEGIFSNEEDRKKAFHQLINGDFESFAKNFDLSSDRDGAVFWSKNQEVASNYAESIGGTTLENTEGGRVLNGWGWLDEKFSTWDDGKPTDQKPLWAAFSSQFANGASGEITYVHPNGQFGDMWNTIEKPIIIDKMKNGEITGFREVFCNAK